MPGRVDFATVTVPVGERSDGTKVYEELLVAALGGGRMRLVRTPGLLLGFARDDEVEIVNGKAVLAKRGRNIAVQIYGSADLPIVRHRLEPAVSRFGASVDGESGRQLVYSFPVDAGFAEVERALNLAIDGLDAEWFFGNVYDPEDGVTPLNWW